MKTTNKKELIIYGIILAVLAVASVFLLGRDLWVFWTWWLLILVLGVVGMPLTGRLFRGFSDKGWIFSKVLAVGVSGYLEWLLVTTRVIPFTSLTCGLLVGTLALFSLYYFLRQNRKGVESLPTENWSLVIREELLFLAMFLLWAWLMGYNAAAYGTEKFMDYGFLESMMRSTTLPPKDIWYSQGTINYYFGGQYFTAFLTKLSTSEAARTYNLMRALIAALAVAMPFSLVRQMLADRLKKRWSSLGKFGKVTPDLAGLTAGVAVTFAGNLHYVWYAVITPMIANIRGEEAPGYWFPDSTRYIGYNPDVPDKTIHEFPCYSFILGDLHAHVVNIIFVILLIGILYAWLSRTRHSADASAIREASLLYDLTERDDVTEREGYSARIQNWMTAPEERRPDTLTRVKQWLLCPWALMAGFLLGLFKMNNYWDFVIYTVVAGVTALFIHIIEQRKGVLRMLGLTLLQTAEMFAVSFLIALPFTMQFETMVDGIGIAQNHSLLHQLLLLWGLPFFLGLLFLICVLRENLKGMENKTLARLMDVMKNPDLFAVLLFICALGLVLIPEFIYVRDIYENGNARANTMFKLTYQSYIMFAIMMGYVIWRLLVIVKGKLVKVLAGIGLFLLCWTVGYFGISVRSWYGTVTPDRRAGLDAIAYMEQSFPEDVEAIYWLRENVKGTPVVLEANGDSYTDYERVSAMTGLPTILGWYVHEWLWRGDPDDLNEKSADVEAIYTSQDQELVARLLKVYDVDYIVVGAREWDKYQDNLNLQMLDQFGDVVFSDDTSGTCIYKIN